MNNTTTSSEAKTEYYCDKCQKEGRKQTNSHPTHFHSEWVKL